jgi:uncharacterized protein
MKVQPLHAALAHDDPKASFPIAEALLRAGADPNAAQHGGWTPLHEAAHHGYLALAELLLAHGADPRAASDDSSTPLQMAERGGHAEVAERLRVAVTG